MLIAIAVEIVSVATGTFFVAMVNGILGMGPLIAKCSVVEVTVDERNHLACSGPCQVLWCFGENHYPAHR